MDQTKCIGMDVHKETISIAVLGSSGKRVMESVIETKASTVVQLFKDCAEICTSRWKREPLRPHVSEVLVCDPRKNALLNVGNKNDCVDAHKLAELACRRREWPSCDTPLYGHTAVWGSRRTAAEIIAMSMDSCDPRSGRRRCAGSIAITTTS